MSDKGMTDKDLPTVNELFGDKTVQEKVREILDGLSVVCHKCKMGKEYLCDECFRLPQAETALTALIKQSNVKFAEGCLPIKNNDPNAAYQTGWNECRYETLLSIRKGNPIKSDRAVLKERGE